MKLTHASDKLRSGPMNAHGHDFFTGEVGKALSSQLAHQIGPDAMDAEGDPLIGRTCIHSGGTHIAHVVRFDTVDAHGDKLVRAEAIESQAAQLADVGGAD